MLKVIRMVKRGDKLPAEFRQEWLERNRELRKTANNLVASVVADGNILPGEPLFQGVAALYYPAINEAHAAHEMDIGKEALSVIAEEKVLYERTGATLKPMGQLKVILTSIRKKELTPAQYKDAALKGYAKVESKMLMDSGILKIVVWRQLPLPSWLALCQAAVPASAQVTPERLVNAAREPQQWLMYSGAYDGSRFSPLDQINRTNVQQLALQWVFQSGVKGAHS